MQNETTSLGLGEKKAKFLFFFLGICSLLVAAILTFPDSFGFYKTAVLANPVHEGGFLYKSAVQELKNKPTQRSFFPSNFPVVLENGIPLKRSERNKEKISSNGWGRYRVSSTEVFFSTSDGSSLENKVFSVRYSSFFLYEGILLLFWVLGVLFLSAAAWISRQANPERPFFSEATTRFFLVALPAFWWGSFFLFPQVLAAELSEGILVSALWAASLGFLCALPNRLALLPVCITALLPAFTSYFYSAILAEQTEFFVLGSTLPWSDATLHFQQAVEISRTGITEIGFNGRFLYPAFFAGILKLCGENIQTAHLLSSSLVLLLLGIVCRMVARGAGASGTAVFALVCWLYIGSAGVGMVMTENLGIACGLVATGLLLEGVSRSKAWMVWLGLLVFSFGMSTRPGALFLLPALAVFFTFHFGWKKISGSFFASLRRPFLAFVLACIAILVGFGANHVALRRIYAAENPAFQNFAFSLHGLLTGTNWSVSHRDYHADAKAVMEENFRLLRERPTRLLQGFVRAAEEVYPKCFFFRFHEEKQYGFFGTLFAALGIVAIVFFPRQRKLFLWLLFGLAGILASLPFAPPWDAGLRPYAVTIPVTGLLAGIGVGTLGLFFKKTGSLLAFATFKISEKPLSFFSGSFWKNSLPAFKKIALSPLPETSEDPLPLPSLLAVSTGIFSLILFPLVFRDPPQTSATPEKTIWDFLPGGALLVSENCAPSDAPKEMRIVPRQKFLDSFSSLRHTQTEVHDFVANQPSDFVLGIAKKDLKFYCIPWPPPPSNENYRRVGQLWVPPVSP